jgi:hypothetical protein
MLGGPHLKLACNNRRSIALQWLRLEGTTFTLVWTMRAPWTERGCDSGGIFHLKRRGYPAF